MRYAALSGFLLLCFLAQFFAQSPHCLAYSPSWQQRRDWLGGRAFAWSGAKGDAMLFLGADGFFALRIADTGKKIAPRDVTGFWRLAPNGVDLTLANALDMEMRLSVGDGYLYGLFGGIGSVKLSPYAGKKSSFVVGGIVLVGADGAIFLCDPASAKNFAISREKFGSRLPEDCKFAAAILEFDENDVAVAGIRNCAKKIPRYLSVGLEKSQYSESVSGRKKAKMDMFEREVAGKFWKLSPAKGVPEASLIFEKVLKNADSAEELVRGYFEISGRGIRCEGDYAVAGDKLTLAASQSTMKNLELVGARVLADVLLGDFKWALEGNSLALINGKGERYALESR